MKVVFFLAAVLGFAGTLAGAHYLPVTQARLPSQTSVAINGGRSEHFIIRLPADRLAATDETAGGIRAARGSMTVPTEPDALPLHVEHFKVRDADDKVIGIAARHWGDTERGLMTTWSVLIPSRGALLLRAPGEARGAVDAALKSAGYTPAANWTGNVAATLTPRGDAGAVAGGTGEFAQIGGSYTETWTLTSIEAGDLRGTIDLATLTQLAP
jgi:hypothetical protein